jgi:hypothetical protein
MTIKFHTSWMLLAFVSIPGCIFALTMALYLQVIVIALFIGFSVILRCVFFVIPLHYMAQAFSFTHKYVTDARRSRGFLHEGDWRVLTKVWLLLTAWVVMHFLGALPGLEPLIVHVWPESLLAKTMHADPLVRGIRLPGPREGNAMLKHMRLARRRKAFQKALDKMKVIRSNRIVPSLDQMRKAGLEKEDQSAIESWSSGFELSNISQLPYTEGIITDGGEAWAQHRRFIMLALCRTNILYGDTRSAITQLILSYLEPHGLSPHLVCTISARLQSDRLLEGRPSAHIRAWEFVKLRPLPPSRWKEMRTNFNCGYPTGPWSEALQNRYGKPADYAREVMGEAMNSILLFSIFMIVEGVIGTTLSLLVGAR